jgi:biotin synthase
MTTANTQWSLEAIKTCYEQPMMDLLYQAQTVHRENFPPNEVQLSTLLSIKTGACPEDCGYCSQSGHHSTELEREKLLSIDTVLENARAAKAKGSTRFCMGAAWRTPPKKDMPRVVEMIKEVKAMGMETCMTLGMLDEEQVIALKEAGLDYYNHNIDTSPDYYEKIVTTRCFQDRLDTLQRVRDAGINVCCGGIMGMGESKEDRFSFLQALVNLPVYPESVPINRLVSVPGTPLENAKSIDDLEFVRTIATARIMMPKAMVRLSAGREAMTRCLQTLCFFAGANSIFYGDKLLTTTNPRAEMDQALMRQLGIHAAANSMTQKTVEI